MGRKSLRNFALQLGLVLIGAISLAVPQRTIAQPPPVNPNFVGSCWITEGATTNVYVRGCNGTGDTLTGVTPSPLDVAGSGTASLNIVTVPTFRRVLVDKNCVTFVWQVRPTGCGTLDVTTDLTAEDTQGITWGTGQLSCGEVVADGAECHPFTPTPTDTPRVRLPTPTPKVKISPTPRTRLPTPTPKPRIEVTPRPRQPTPTAKPTKVPIIVTPRPRLPTPTLKPPKVKATLRPTRTPIPPPALACPDLSKFQARCIALNPTGPLVNAHLQVFNNTGGDLVNVIAGPIEVDGTKTARATSVSGPTPNSISLLGDGKSARFSLGVRPTGQGQLFIHVTVRASAPGCEPASVQRRVECNTVNLL